MCLIKQLAAIIPDNPPRQSDKRGALSIGDIDFALNLLKDLRGGQVDRATASDQV